MTVLDVASLALYRTAREKNCDDFQDAAFALLKNYVPFDSARWATASVLEDGVLFHSAHLFNELPSWGDAYNQVRSLDKIAAFVVAHPERTNNFHAASYLSSRADAELREYTRRYRHETALITGHTDKTTGLSFNISLYGANPDRPFSEDERLFVESLYPHLMEAWAVNQSLQMERTRCAPGGRRWSIAVCTPCGHIALAEPSFFQLLRHEWPAGRQLDVLPAALADTLRTGAAGYKGHSCVFRFERRTDLAFVRARERTLLDQLSERELAVARHVAAGRTHKEIARLLGIAPATVRNHLQAIHERVGIHNNVDLVVQLKDNGLET